MKRIIIAHLTPRGIVTLRNALVAYLEHYVLDAGISLPSLESVPSLAKQVL